MGAAVLPPAPYAYAFNKRIRLFKSDVNVIVITKVARILDTLLHRLHRVYNDCFTKTLIHRRPIYYEPGRFRERRHGRLYIHLDYLPKFTCIVIPKD